MKKLIVFLALALTACGGGLLPPLSFLQSANISAAIVKWETTPATYNFLSPPPASGGAGVPASLAVGTGGAVTLSANNVTVGSGVLKFSASGDYLSGLFSGIVTDTATTQTSLAMLSSVGQTGSLYTDSFTSGGTSVLGTTAVTYVVSAVGTNLISLCMDFVFTANANPYGLSSGNGQACWFIDGTNTVKGMSLILNGVPFAQQ